ncbi:MAG: hypothetical protein H7839_01525 [Magnetococcus sp. YQC-5]
MNRNTVEKVGFTVAFLLLLSWPTAYIMNRLDPGAGHPIESLHLDNMPRHAGFRAAFQSTLSSNKSYRMGITLDQYPFSQESAP